MFSVFAVILFVLVITGPAVLGTSQRSMVAKSVRVWFPYGMHFPLTCVWVL